MPSSKINEYIQKHSIGSECLFKDWESFLKLLYAENGHVSAILWWDHCRRSEERDSVGGGGYIDPEDPEYIYLETQEYRDGLDSAELSEILAYIGSVREKGIRYGNRYHSHDLRPSFYFD